MEVSKAMVVETIPKTESNCGPTLTLAVTSINSQRKLMLLENPIKFGINNTLKDTLMITSMLSQEVNS